MTYYRMVAIEIGQIVQDFAVIMIVSSVMALLSYKLSSLW